MKVKWLGHACFEITTSQNIKVLTDPYNSSAYGDIFTYQEVFPEVDLVTISHRHSDHGYIEGVPGKPEVIDKPGASSFKDLKVKGISTYHDQNEGKERGQNIIFLIDDGNIQLVHCGDLGHIPEKNKLIEIKEKDILLIPIGGFFTIDANEALEIIDQIKPRVVIPMHFKNEKCKFTIDDHTKFISGQDKVTRLNKTDIEIDFDSLPGQTEIYILNPAN